jgi:hypothetical protein
MLYLNSSYSQVSIFLCWMELLLTATDPNKLEFEPNKQLSTEKVYSPSGQQIFIIFSTIIRTHCQHSGRHYLLALFSFINAYAFRHDKNFA